MAIKIDRRLTPQKLVPKLERFFDLSGQKILSIQKSWRMSKGAPVSTVKGQYTTRGWTEWTQGFQFGSAVLQYDATGDERFLKYGRRGTVKYMARTCHILACTITASTMSPPTETSAGSCARGS